eukprot:gb/GEZJ01005807.1/.p2 GENE.gb/GEZJ01005807.1/~~gb/GEZJ01005807.1/.p2  ORF type:complete len:146 (+),score=11.12 gb/GEZJ01005807.1/:344-781(+)
MRAFRRFVSPSTSTSVQRSFCMTLITYFCCVAEVPRVEVEVREPSMACGGCALLRGDGRRDAFDAVNEFRKLVFAPRNGETKADESIIFVDGKLAFIQEWNTTVRVSENVDEIASVVKARELCLYRGWALEVSEARADNLAGEAV